MASSSTNSTPCFDKFIQSRVAKSSPFVLAAAGLIFFIVVMVMLSRLYISDGPDYPVYKGGFPEGWRSEGSLKGNGYRSQRAMAAFMKRLTTLYPDMCRMYEIGRSVKGQALMILQISANVSRRDLGKPAFAYIANMHGNEPTGRELLLRFADYLLTHYGKDSQVTRLVNKIDIHLLPSMNPDGYLQAVEGACVGFTGRYNEYLFDLNRIFFGLSPDRAIESRLRREVPEAAAVKEWLQRDPNFVLAGALHGGTLAVVYPYNSRDYNGEAETPDNELFKDLARAYASLHPTMQMPKQCYIFNFTEGIINGAAWYDKVGTLSDYAYGYTNTFMLTLEVSCCKFPPANKLSKLWDENKLSLLGFMERTLTGVRGIVTDANTDEAVQTAEVKLAGIDHVIRVSDLGEYWRLLIKGATYNITFSAPGYEDVSATFTVPERAYHVLNISLRPKSGTLRLFISTNHSFL